MSTVAMAAPTAQELAAKLDRIRRPCDAFELQLDINETHDGKSKPPMTLRVMARKAEGTQHFDAVTLCLAPDADKGKVLLDTAAEVWFLAPKAKTPIRMSAQQFQAKAFLGEILGTSQEADYDIEAEADETVQDASRKEVICYHLKLTPKSPSSTGLVEYWVDKQLLQPVKAQFASAQGKIQRTLYYAAYASVLGELRPTRLLVVSNTEQGHITDIKISNVRRAEWKAGMFTKEALGRREWP